MGIKYYYSAPQQLRQALVIADCNGNTVYQFDNGKLVKMFPRVTICSILDGNKLSFGYTVCSDKDQFVRKIGQKISYARALNKPFMVIENFEMKDIHIISEDVINKIYEIETKRIYKCII